MGADSRLSKAFDQALVLPWEDEGRYVFLSDCHRGCGTSNDNFLRNQNLFFAALQYYYEEGYHYIELGDGDELWENRSIGQIMDIHSDAFWMMSRFYREGRLHLIYGNHDLVKRSESFSRRLCTSYYCTERRDWTSLFPDIRFYESVILENREGGRDLYLTHGHQADVMNSTLWKFTRFLVRYIWKPLERAGFLDPTSAAKNNTKKEKVEQRLLSWARKQSCILVTGHTHRPTLDEKGLTPYLNTGSCVHPRCITAIELKGRAFSLVKWTYCIRPDFSVYVCRDVLAGPVVFDTSS